MRSSIDILLNNKIFDEIRSEHENLVKGEKIELQIDLLKIKRSTDIVDYNIPQI